MNESPQAVPPPAGLRASLGLLAGDPAWRRFLLAGAGLVLGFSVPLYQVAQFARHRDLYSHILLVPLISLYLVWLDRDRLLSKGPPVNPAWTAASLIAGVGFLVWYSLQVFSPASTADAQDTLAVAMYAFVFLLAGLALLFLNRNAVGLIAFPLGFLIFLAPFPGVVEAGLEAFLQHASSLAASCMLQTAGMPVFRDGTFFRLPNFSMQVAPECSGIHSTLALFITSLVAGQLLLRSPAKRLLLAAVVLPIAILRNGFRVFVIGELCVRIGPEMIDSWIHHHGGPVFFVLSLAPFSLILYYLLKSERTSPPPLPSATPS